MQDSIRLLGRFMETMKKIVGVMTSTKTKMIKESPKMVTFYQNVEKKRCITTS